MFRLIIGKAGVGKTGIITSEISDAVKCGRGGSYLLVPELFSYEAQKELCRVCGDRLSLCASVTTFTNLARQIAEEVGGMAKPYMDDGGRLLCMSLALIELQKSDVLKYYRNSAHRYDVARLMLSAVDEMKQSLISPSELLEASESFDESLAGKLQDLAVISEKYDEIVFEGHLDPADRLNILAEQIASSSLGSSDTFYIDGFIGFTESEYNVIYALMKKGVNMVVCLTLDRYEDNSEYFAVPRSTMNRLKSMADALSIEYTTQRYVNSSDPAKEERILCANIMEECEYSAVKVLSLVRDRSCRFRDIAIAVRGFDDYRPMLESIFEKYSIPLYTARKEAVASKNLCVFISCAYDVILNGFAVDDVIALIGTGLTGLESDEADCLCEYIFKWNLREGHWRQSRDWYFHPEGYGKEYTDETREYLSYINKSRSALGIVLIEFADSNLNSSTVHEYALSLSVLLDRLQVSKHLPDSSAQLWDVCVSALEQIDAVLGDKAMETEEFYRLYMQMLSTYDIGSIPDSVDSVSAGDFDRMRRRNIKHLIVLGSSEDRLPAQRADTGIFSTDELDMLADRNILFGDYHGENIFREFSLIYSCFNLPSDSIYYVYSGNPSFVINTGATESRYIPLKPTEVKSAPRGKLSAKSIESLYGNNLYISASKADRYYSCKYSYFCNYGMKIKPYKSATFSSSEIGTFVHHILEKVASETASLGGFDKVDDDALVSMTRRYIDEYVEAEFNNYADKDDRFVFLFKRVENDTFSIVLDTARELRKSKFVPCEFELDFSDRKQFPPITVNNGTDSLYLSGIADRVDEWVSDDRHFLRVVDYKTGTKKFSLSDIWYGTGMQMLLYLYALSMGTNEKIVPAGVMYIPANNKFVPLSSAPLDGEDETERIKSRRRSGIVLDSFGVPDAWETGEEKIFEPKKSTMDLEQFDLLTRHMSRKLSDMAEGIRCGEIDADPFRKGSDDISCKFCDFRGSCGFCDGENGESVRNLKKLSSDTVWEKMGEEVAGNE